MSLQPNAVTSFFLRVSAIRALALYAVHTVVFTACYAAAWLVRFEFSIPPEFLQVFKSSFAVVVGVQLMVGFFFSFYRGWWRYVGLADVVRLVFGMTTSLTLLIGAWYLGGTFGIDDRFVRVPRGVLLIDWSFSLLTLFGARVAIRLGRDRFRSTEEAPMSARRVLIVGAGDAGETLAREIEHRPQLGMKVVGFVDDQRAKWHSHIRGINIYGPISSIGTLADTLGADEALIAIPSASGKRIREILHHLAAADLRFKTMPGIDHLVSGKVHVTQLRPVNVEDLMRRKRVDLPGDPVRELFRGKRVLVTGAGGTIGTELAVQIAQFEPESLVLLERSEFALYESRKRLSREVPWSTSKIIPALVNLTDYDVVDATLAHEKPQIVLHAAAHKHVGLGEENPPEYVRNNCVATRRLAELCVDHNVERFVLISTDKAINPTSVMGASKRAAEIALLDVAAREKMKVTAVRFGNVIGSSGSVIPLFMEQIAAGGPVTVTHPEVTRYFLRTSEAVSLVLQAATLGEHGCIFMLDMGEPVKIVDLARDMVRLSNHTEEEIPIVFTGLRAGEKLYEEIRLQGESIKPTVHPQIVVTEAPQPDSRVVAQWLEKAQAATNGTETIALLARLIPEYTPSVPLPAPPSSFSERPLRIVSESGATV